jgi:hypothetical protein
LSRELWSHKGRKFELKESHGFEPLLRRDSWNFRLDYLGDSPLTLSLSPMMRGEGEDEGKG